MCNTGFKDENLTYIYENIIFRDRSDSSKTEKINSIPGQFQKNALPVGFKNWYENWKAYTESKFLPSVFCGHL